MVSVIMIPMLNKDLPDKERLRRQALLLVSAGAVWDVLEAGVALWSGISAGSVALVAFGLDSFIELFASGVLVWHLTRERQRHDEATEKRAHRLVGITFFLLSAYIAVQAIGTLLGWFNEPRESVVGIVLVILSALVMTSIFFPKLRLANKLNSRALRGEAMENLVCDLQSLAVLVGLVTNAFWGFWWADPIAALVLIPLMLKEGWEGVKGEANEEE